MLLSIKQYFSASNFAFICRPQVPRPGVLIVIVNLVMC